MPNINSCRASAFTAFRTTLAEFRGKPVTEVQFRDAWLAKLQQDPSLFAAGWYDPPPHGMAVLFARGDDPSRMSYESLRQEAAWPDQTKADWRGFLFAYCSCISRTTGKLGDFDLTLYFGDDPQLKTHYRNCFNATAQLLHSISPADTSHALFMRAEEIFAQANLRLSTTSITAVTPAVLGHTFPVLPQSILDTAPTVLAAEHKNLIRTARHFIDRVSDWSLADGLQFTVEPQLRSALDPALPKISFHYLAQVKDGQVQICRDIDELITPLLN